MKKKGGKLKNPEVETISSSSEEDDNRDDQGKEHFKTQENAGRSGDISDIGRLTATIQQLAELQAQANHNRQPQMTAVMGSMHQLHQTMSTAQIMPMSQGFMLDEHRADLGAADQRNLAIERTHDLWDAEASKVALSQAPRRVLTVSWDS